MTAIAYVQDKQGTAGATTSVATAYTNPTALGNLLLVLCGNATGVGSAAISDNLSHVWTPLFPLTAIVGVSDAFQAWATISLGGSVTVTLTEGVSTFLIPMLSEFTWPTSKFSVDGNPQTSGTVSSVSTVVNIIVNPNQNQELAIGQTTVNAGVSLPIVNAPFTIFPASNNNLFSGYKIVSAAGPITYGGSYTGSGPNGSVAFVLSPLSVFSYTDDRTFGPFPNASRNVQGTLIDDVPAHNSDIAPNIPVDSRVSPNIPVDSRVAPNIPTNSRTPGVNGPGN